MSLLCFTRSRTSQGPASLVGSLAAVSALIASALLSGCGPNASSAAAQQAPGPIPVSVVRLEPQDISITGQWVGTMDGFVNAQIQPQVTGYLVRQLYREGSPVSKGQVLFQIDRRTFDAAVEQAQGQVAQARGQVAQAEAQVAQSQAQYELAQINLNRDTPLAQARAIAQSQLDNDKQTASQAAAAVHVAQAQVQSASASVTAAEAALQTAKLNLGFTEVHSLIDGVAGQATTQVGNLVNPQSVLTSVSQLNPIKVYFSISDTEYLALAGRSPEAGADLLRAASRVPLTLTLANGQNHPYKGRIIFVDRQMNAGTGAIRIAASFPNPGNVLRPGQFARVSGETEQRHGALLVPQIAVQELQGIQQVYIAGSDNKVHTANVKLGRQYGSNWVVEEGLKPGAAVITDNLQKLRDGVPVSPHPARTPPASEVDNSGPAEAR